MATDREPHRATESLAQDLHERLERFHDTLRKWEESIDALNVATVDDIKQLLGFGPVLAERIATHRDRNGPFKKVEDVLEVTGIGAIKLAALRNAVSADPAPAAARATTRYERQSAHLPALGEAARDFTAAAPRLRMDRKRRSRFSRQSTKG